MRPKGPKSKGEQAVLDLCKRSGRFLLRLKTQLNPELLNLSSEELNAMAANLVELTEDLQLNDRKTGNYSRSQRRREKT